jgi:DNA mismatch repair protein MutL
MIIKLHENLINKIAAGEVVERPASVLKELLENAIDAKATKIEVKLEKAGTKLIEVIDNGTGMDREDAKIACDSHTTSKITTIQDLDNIFTMGFRGEALASIGAVSKLTLETKNNKNKIGTKVTVENGKARVEDVTKEVGTRVSVERLFHNVPARKKFLKSESTEYKHILVTFINYALAYPNIHFILTHNKKSVYNLPSVAKDNFNAELKVRLNDLLKSRVTDELVEVRYSSPYIKIEGFTAHPKAAKSRKSYQSIFLNNRPIIDKLISKAVYDAYLGLIPKGLYPIFFLFLTIDPSKVDVNVHPRKSEVRFSDGQSIYQAVKQAAKGSLLKFLQNDAKKALDKYPEYKPESVGVQNLEPDRKSVGDPNLRPITQKPIDNTVRAENLSAVASAKADFQPNQKPTGQQISSAISFTKEILKPESVGMEYIPSNSSLPPAFQLFATYIIIEKGDKIFFIDQHAAAERVTYEKLQKQIKNGRIDTQKLLIPEVVEVNKIEFEALKENRKDLEKLGIRLAIFGKSAFKVEEIPILIAKANVKKLIEDVLSELKNDTVGVENFQPVRDIQDHIIATMACHTSIRAGMKLHQAEIDDLARKLLACENPYSCPHGRPVMWEMPRGELEKKFKRA